MALYLAPQLGNQALRGLRKQLRKGKRRDSLSSSGSQHQQHQRFQKLYVMLGDNRIDQEPGRVGQH